MRASERQEFFQRKSWNMFLPQAPMSCEEFPGHELANNQIVMRVRLDISAYFNESPGETRSL